MERLPLEHQILKPGKGGEDGALTFKAHFGHTQSGLDTMWAQWRGPPLGCHGLSLRFPTLARQENGAWNGSLAAGVIGHLAP